MPTTTRRRNAPARLHIVAKPVAPAIAQSVDDYLAEVKARGGSPRTAEYYEETLTKRFLPWCAAHDVTGLDQLTQAHLNRFNADLLDEVNERTGKPLARASVNTYLRAVRQLLSWAKKNGTDHQLTVQQVKVPKVVKETLSRQQINDLEGAAPTERDKLIIRILGDAGLRLSELLALTEKSLIEGEGSERHKRWLLVDGKGSRQRHVPITPAVFQRLKRYIDKTRPHETSTRRIFLSLRRRPESGQYEALDARAVQQMLNAVANRAGIHKANPHLFRHSMITNSLRAGVNVIALAHIVGHSDLSMIHAVYAHLNKSDEYDQLIKSLVTD